jgi:hypothetical protein
MAAGRGRRVATGAVLVLVASACVGSSSVPARAPAHVLSGDSSVFAAVVMRMSENARGVPLRVDPRPLRPDPAIVELTPSVALAAPDLVAAVPQVLAPVSRRVVHRRSAALARLGVPEGNVFQFAGCPAVLLPPELRESQGRREGCPAEAHATAIVGIPRPGGAYWPGSHVDNRAQAAEGIWSTRVIQRHLSPAGASATASDYVAQRVADGRWRIIGVVHLLVAE